MTWFADFVHETVDSYAKLSGGARRGTAFEERLNAIKAEHRVFPTFIGHAGERVMQAAIERCGYEVIRSPGSRSPADLWGCGTVGEIVHFPLLQVKTARAGGEPERLSAEEERGLATFALFVGDELLKSPRVPPAMRKLPIIVSAAYSGVVLDETDQKPIKCVIRWIDAVGTEEIQADWKRWTHWLDEAYGRLRPQ